MGKYFAVCLCYANGLRIDWNLWWDILCSHDDANEINKHRNNKNLLWNWKKFQEIEKKKEENSRGT